MNNEYMTELRWTLDDMLIKAKQNPMPIIHNFDRRFLIWKNQILPGRLNAIYQCNGNPEYILRMVALTLDDYDRLVERSRKEFEINKNMDQYCKRNRKLFTITKETIFLYEEQNND